MGRVAKPQILSRQNPQMRKNLGLRFDKESEGYLLSPSLHVASCLTPIWEELLDTINIQKGLPSD